MIIQTISTIGQFRDAMQYAGRGNQFSYEGMALLFEYLSEVSDATESPIEFDAVAICCDFREADADEVRADYDLSVNDNIGEYLNKNGVLVGITSSGAYVFQQF